jgi:hypothetical protein
MKATLKNALFIFSILCSSVFMTATAQEKTPFNVEYAGVNGSNLSFVISWTNLQGATELMIKDKTGSVIYRDEFSETRFKKRFLLPKDENDMYTFIITNGKTKITRKFTVSTSFVEEITVNEL